MNDLIKYVEKTHKNTLKFQMNDICFQGWQHTKVKKKRKHDNIWIVLKIPLSGNPRKISESNQNDNLHSILILTCVLHI